MKLKDDVIAGIVIVTLLVSIVIGLGVGGYYLYGVLDLAMRNG